MQIGFPIYENTVGKINNFPPRNRPRISPQKMKIQNFWGTYPVLGPTLWVRDWITISQCFFDLNSSRWGKGVSPHQDRKKQVVSRNLVFSVKIEVGGRGKFKLKKPEVPIRKQSVCFLLELNLKGIHLAKMGPTKPQWSCDASIHIPLSKFQSWIGIVTFLMWLPLEMSCS